MNIEYEGISDVGYERTINEDFIAIERIDENILFAIVLDGSGSKNTGLQPGSLIATEMINSLNNFHKSNKTILLNYPEVILQECMNNAGKVLGAFKMGNDELYAGLGASATAILICDDKLSCCHCGNTRLYLIRSIKDNVKMLQLTKDQTVANKLLENKKISEEDYYYHSDRFKIIGGLGIVAEPKLQHFSIPIKTNDVLALTTDGIHYAIRGEFIKEIILQSSNCLDAVNSLKKAVELQEYSDNLATIIMQIKKEDK